MNRRMRAALPAFLALAITLLVPLPGIAQSPQDLMVSDQGARAQNVPVMDEVRHAVIRLPLAALLGTALAMRPKRKGTPPRQPGSRRSSGIVIRRTGPRRSPPC